MSSKKKKSSKKKTTAKPYSKKNNKKNFKKQNQYIAQAVQEINPPEQTAETTDAVEKMEAIESIIREKAPRFPFLFRRFLETLIVSLIFSIPFEALRVLKASDSIAWGTRLSLASFAAFIAASIYLFRVFFFSMGNKKMYFKINILSYTLYAAIGMILLYFPETRFIYSFIFMPMNYISYLLYDIFNGIIPDVYRFPSAILTHIIMYLLIFISPLEMYGIEKKLQKRRK